MTTTLRVQVTLPNVNGLPADAFTNTWHCRSDGLDPLDDLGDFVNALGDFYGAIDVFLASTVDTSAVVKAYDLTHAEPRAPIAETAFSITPGANAPLPSEVACVVSYNGAHISGVPVGRRRGRIFLGPLDSAVMDDTAGQSLLQTSTITAIAAAAEGLMAAGDIGGFRWGVFSPTGAGVPPWTALELSGNTYSVVSGHVDNAFDTQRSRGVAATSRVSWP